MTSVEGFVGDKLYLDTNVLIHFVEGHPAYGASLNALFTAIQEQAITALTSELTLAEVLVKPLVKPLVEGKSEIVAVYETLLSGTGPIRVMPVDRTVLLQSARIRARHGGRAFDAIHVATAALCECDFFLSADARIRIPDELRLVSLSELTIDP